MFDEATKQAVSSPEYFRQGFLPHEAYLACEMFKEGKTPEEISAHFQVSLEVVKKFCTPEAAAQVPPAAVESAMEEDPMEKEVKRGKSKRG